ncbi:type I restriction endonuclease subunit R [Campylobacter jejuni]|uniref:type I restriction endonuclease subunit R n=1 Tax=Campylobacter jejuni TaxID=197 RepID=UPI0005773A9D|nr:type I restriction endonuclease subunit R [Campylobacter jejuni]
MNDLITQNDNTTIIAEYKFIPKEPKAYQSEEDLERFLIKELTLQGYERLDLSDINDLESNLKSQLQRLNHISFSPTEWESFYKQNIINPKLTFEDKTKMLQSDNFTLTLDKDDGSKKNIILIDRTNPINNHLQVISQLKNESGEFKNRYDVSILVNGLPLVHIELKRRGINLKEAFNQIRRYQKESFLKGSALYEFVQIFIISNGTLTKYYSNTNQHKAKKSQNDNYAFCMSFSDAKNNIIEDLEDFTKTFLAKRNLLNILTKYCVFKTNKDDNKELLIMRPYQIAASERIIDKIKIAHNHKYYGSVEAGGYIWHSTGSGKTLTSFKSAILATKLPFIKKVLFVVDRKDLDYQTQKEYDKFEKGAANATKNTDELKRRIESTKEDEKIITTTIQKLSNFVQKYENSRIFDSEIVFIFDECHRSQFGLMHEQIIKKFKKYYIFGFTGTPIFEENAGKNYFVNSDKNLELKTTKSTFGACLHSYTILNAIKDKNVLPFKVSYHSTMKQLESQNQSDVSTIDKESALLNSQRIQKIVSYILENFNRHTKRQSAYTLKNQRVQGFNAIFATASVDFAKIYYEEFSRQLKQNKQDLKVGIIYSYEQNEDLDEFASDTQSAKEFLSNAIKDYNSYFKSDFSLEKFDNYYKDISQKLKNKELDLLIVVNMFLTGFDSKTINTLNLKHHGLLQAFSRTNRILNEQKNCGNVVCFRDLENATNESLKMFGDERASSIVLLENFAFYFEKYSALVDELKQKFELLNFPLKKQKEQQEFINIFNEILKLENILNLFDEFKNPLDIRDKQDYQSHYLELYNTLKKEKEKENINEDLIFEIELIKQNEINVDFILFLLEEYHKDSKEKTKENILKTIISNPSLRDKKELIQEFLEQIDHNKNSDYKSLFESFMQRKKEQELQQIIKDENLNEHLTKQYLEEAFELNFFQDKGENIGKLLPLINPFAPKSEGNEEKREQIINKLKSFFDKFIVFLKKEENE